MAETGRSLALLTAHFLSDAPKDLKGWHLNDDCGSHLPKLRTNQMRKLLKRGCTHILSIDADMQFPWDSLDRLLKHKQPIVAANYVRKVSPYTPVAIGKDGKHCFTDESKSGLEEVWQVGMGLMLIETHVFQDLPEPWFPMGWSESRQDYIGEDVYFCHLVRNVKKLPVFVDHDLSKDVSHIGHYGFNHELPEMVNNASALRIPDAARPMSNGNGARHIQ